MLYFVILNAIFNAAHCAMQTEREMSERERESAVRGINSSPFAIFIELTNA